MQTNTVPVNVVVAHPLEAKALIPMLQLQASPADSNYPLYLNSDGLQLIVSGMGRAAVADAVRFLAEQQVNDAGQIRGWLNIGIAGHRDAELGSGWLANKITEQASLKCFYPPQLISGIPSSGVVTVDEPEHAYPVDAVYEMEASAFFEMASSYSTAELVQLFKIVSDNLENPISSLDLKRVPAWIASHEVEIKSLLRGLSELVSLYNGGQELGPVYQDICLRWRLTVNQKLQLKRLCQRYRALGREDQLADLVSPTLGDAKQLLSRLSSSIDKLFISR